MFIGKRTFLARCLQTVNCFVGMLGLLHNIQSPQHLQCAVFKAQLVTLQLILSENGLFPLERPLSSNI